MTRIEVPVALRWSDLDAYGHVNNVALLTLLEEARIAAFWAPTPAGDGSGAEVASGAEVPSGVAGGDAVRSGAAVLHAGPGARVQTLVARQEVEYLRPLAYQRAPVTVSTWVGALGGASLDVCYEVLTGPAGGLAPPPAAVVARALTTLVLVDAATGSPVRMTPEQRAAWQVYIEPPVALRRRH